MVCLIGGFSFIHGCSRISATPILSSAVVFSSFFTRSFAVKEKFLGKPILHALILLKSSDFIFDRNGASPTRSSNNRTPRFHISNLSPCPILSIISGAKYSSVPQYVHLSES